MSKRKTNKLAVIACCLTAFVIGLLGGAYIKTVKIKDYLIPETQLATVFSNRLPDPLAIREKELTVHFLELGNIEFGDCAFIKAGETEVLIDAGSNYDSVTTIYEYIAPLIDGNLDYVISTHAHMDHYVCFATPKNRDSLFDLFKIDTIITFAQTNKEESGIHANFMRELDETKKKNGTKVYTVLQCWNNEGEAKRIYPLSDTVELEFLYQKYYEEKEESENNYSVCLKINRTWNGKTDSYLFTGDLEKKGEKSLVESNDLGECLVYKAAHHGSKTSSTDTLLSVIKPKIACVTCVAGSTYNTTELPNTFPTQSFIDNISKYTDEVYVTTRCIDFDKGLFTSMNGNIIIATPKNKNTIERIFSASTTKLKDTDWFKEFRECPKAWELN